MAGGAPVRVAVVGATGRLGSRLIDGILGAADLDLAAAVGSPRSAALGRDVGEGREAGATGVVYTAPGRGFGAADVVVDVSTLDGLRTTLAHLDGRPLVTGVTGLDADADAALASAASKGPVLVAANFSAGVALLRSLVTAAAKALPDADVEIVETHHRHKVDAPSGTAKALIQAVEDGRGAAAVRHGREGVIGPRPAGEIGVHALRLGDVVGEHTVWLGTDGERLCLGHVATSREVFAAGALRAARWIVGRPPGRYGMDDVLGL